VARPTGKDEAAAIRNDIKVLQARVPNWNLEKGGVTRWGESSEANYSEYLDFLLKWGVINAKVRPQDVMTNELIDEINRFDSARVAADAKAYGAREAASGFQRPPKGNRSARLGQLARFISVRVGHIDTV
jgi:hypothetical protein